MATSSGLTRGGSSGPSGGFGSGGFGPCTIGLGPGSGLFATGISGVVEFARAQGASIVVRGLRAISDFEYEFQMALMNRQLWSGLETVFLAADAKHSYLSASLVREIASLGGDVAEFVDPVVLDRLHKKLARS